MNFDAYVNTDSAPPSRFKLPALLKGPSVAVPARRNLLINSDGQMCAFDYLEASVRIFQSHLVLSPNYG